MSTWIYGKRDGPCYQRIPHIADFKNMVTKDEFQCFNFHLPLQYSIIKFGMPD